MSEKLDPHRQHWLEISATVACWVGIVGLIVLIAHSALQSAWAQGMPESEALPPPMNTMNSPFGNRQEPPKPDQGGLYGQGSFFEDDFEDDDLDYPGESSDSSSIRSEQSHPNSNPSAHSSAGLNSSGRSKNTPTHSYSAGGRPTSDGPSPIRTDKGISVGGNPANNVVSKNSTPPVKVDTLSAVGGADLITDFNFPDADIMDIAKTLGKLTGKNFILDKDVKGRITVISNSPITVSEAWKVFLTALDMNGFALIPSGKYLRIARQRDAREKQLKTYTGNYSPDTDALITRVFPLKYIAAEDIARTFRSFMPANSRVIPYAQTNTLIVTDTGSNIAKLSQMLDLLDVEGYDAGIEVVPVRYASAEGLSKLINDLIPGTVTAGRPGGAPGMPSFGGGSKFSARKTKEGGIINTIIADERTNTLIIHANAKGADQVRELVAKLDQKPTASSGSGKVHVVYLQFADAEQIANTLNNFSSQTSGGKGPGGGQGGTGVNPNAANLFEGSVKISPDKSTNALVITASPTDFITVQRVINRLDIPRDQVYVEVVLMEVSTGKGFNFSSNIVNTPSMLGSITSPTDLLTITNPLSSKGALLPLRLGGDTTVTVNGVATTVPNVLGLIKMIQTNNLGNVLATPQLIALDNAEANFESSEKVPYQGPTTVVGGGALTTPAIQYNSITTSIKIKPQINKITNFVKLEVTAKMGSIQNTSVPKSLQDSAVGTLDRTAQTTVTVGDSDTIVLGGLVRDETQEIINKIPILGDIPLLGWLFKSKDTKVAKSNLLIFMTPHIIRQYEEIRTVLDRKLKERDDFIESTIGGDDPLRAHRDSIIRSLPNLEELQNNHPPATVSLDDDEDDANPAAVAVDPRKTARRRNFRKQDGVPVKSRNELETKQVEPKAAPPQEFQPDTSAPVVSSEAPMAEAPPTPPSPPTGDEGSANIETPAPPVTDVEPGVSSTPETPEVQETQ